ncbi:hypothetical protein ABIA00_007823 [Bradyrhizobium ottawaense]
MIETVRSHFETLPGEFPDLRAPEISVLIQSLRKHKERRLDITLPEFGSDDLEVRTITVIDRKPDVRRTPTTLNKVEGPFKLVPANPIGLFSRFIRAHWFTNAMKINDEWTQHRNHAFLAINHKRDLLNQNSLFPATIKYYIVTHRIKLSAPKCIFGCPIFLFLRSEQQNARHCGIMEPSWPLYVTLGALDSDKGSVSQKEPRRISLRIFSRRPLHRGDIYRGRKANAHQNSYSIIRPACRYISASRRRKKRTPIDDIRSLRARYLHLLDLHTAGEFWRARIGRHRFPSHRILR